ncbi:uncharacterized protein LOC116175512 [Photinus pyralis]|uniref:uncharacterized protein LOC116175512 n=1 Tax=Photinus pyralis TaxID=7054 RepID=UPI0012676048|nr:uncharacterized protein LOC116175512 [Photinus pyralis]
MCLMDSVECNNTILYGKGTSEVKKEAWEKVTARVNAVGGCTKSGDGWKNAFTVWKSHIRKKIREGTTLTDLEERCSKLSGLPTVATGMETITELGMLPVEDNITIGTVLELQDVEIEHQQEEDLEQEMEQAGPSTIVEPKGTTVKKNRPRKTPNELLENHTLATVDGLQNISLGLQSLASAINNLAKAIREGSHDNQK